MGPQLVWEGRVFKAGIPHELLVGMEGGEAGSRQESRAGHPRNQSSECRPRTARDPLLESLLLTRGRL